MHIQGCEPNHKEINMIDSTDNISKAGSYANGRVQHSRAHEKTDAPKSGSPSSSHSTPADTVELTPESQEMLRLMDTAKEQPALDQEKIERIKQAIADGKYPLDSQKTASNMLGLERLLSSVK
jgi:negative regulator of flagellin synthesis FlgM